jgi:hypothetical protein
MAADKSTLSKESTSLSLDTWAVVIALLLALAVRLNVLRNLPW